MSVVYERKSIPDFAHTLVICSVLTFSFGVSEIYSQVITRFLRSIRTFFAVRFRGWGNFKGILAAI